MSFIRFCRAVYFILLSLWLPAHAYASGDTTGAAAPFVFTEENKQRTKDIANGYSTSSSGVADKVGNTHDVLDRSNKFFRYDEETTGVLGDQTQTMDFSSNGSIKTNAMQFENSLIGSGDASSEGRVYKLLNKHREAPEYKEPSSKLKELSDDLTLTDDNPATNSRLQGYLDMDAQAQAGVVCRNVDPEPIIETRTVTSQHFCSEQVGNIYLETSCSATRTLITPAHEFADAEKSVLEDGDLLTTTYKYTMNGEGEVDFYVSEIDSFVFDLDIKSSSKSAAVLLNNSFVLSYESLTEIPSSYLVEGKNTFKVIVQDSNWKDEPFDYVDGEKYVCTKGTQTYYQRHDKKDRYTKCVDTKLPNFLGDIDPNNEMSVYLEQPRGWKKSDSKPKVYTTMPGEITWGEKYQGNFVKDLGIFGITLNASHSILCTGSIASGNAECRTAAVGESKHSSDMNQSLAGLSAKLTSVWNSKSYNSEHRSYNIFSNTFSPDKLGFRPANWVGKTDFTLVFKHKKIIETIREIPSGCISNPSSVTVQVIGGPVLTNAVGVAVPQENFTDSPLGRSNETWECLDARVSHINAGVIPVTINKEDSTLLREMYPGEKISVQPEGICFKVKARKFLVNINNASACDDGTWSCYGADYIATENAGNAWLGIVGNNAGCDELKKNSECSITNNSCEIRNSDTGECTYTGLSFSCSKEITTVSPSPASSVVCNAPFPCASGDDSCGDLNITPSTSFAQTAGMLTAANMISKEGKCANDDPSTCILFGGESGVCRDKVSVEGYGGKDCCENPTDFTTADGIRLAIAIASTDFFQDLVASMYNAVANAAKDLFVDLMADQATDVAVDAAAQAAVDTAAHSATSAAASSAATTGASSAGAAGATTATGSIASSATMQAIGSAVSFVGAVYTAYVIAKALYDIATQCNADDFSTASKLGMGECLQYDSYCSDRNGFGTCITHKRKFCCYTSAFSKHLNKEIFDKGLGGRSLVDSSSCEGLSMNDIANLDWSQITLEGWIDELMVGGIIPTSDGYVVGEVNDSGVVNAGALSEEDQATISAMTPKEQEDYARGMSQLKGDNQLTSPAAYFSEENMVDLVGKVTEDPDAATASSNAEEVFEKYEDLRIEDVRADTRRELLYDTLYEQLYETCGYEHVSDLNYSVEKLQRFIVDEDGTRIDRGECSVYDGVSAGFMHKFTACSVGVVAGKYIPNMTRYFTTEDGVEKVDNCAPQNFDVSAQACGISHHIKYGYSQSDFVLTANSITAGSFVASPCGYAELHSARYPHVVNVCAINISHPNMLISHETKVVIEGATETVVSCNHDETIPLNYSECGTEHLEGGYKTRYQTSYLVGGVTHDNNDCGLIDGVSLFKEYSYNDCGVELVGKSMVTKHERMFVYGGVDRIQTSCSIVDGVSVDMPLEYESCGFEYAADESKTSKYIEFYMRDGRKIIRTDCSVIEGVSETTFRGKKECGIDVDVDTDTVTKSVVYSDQSCDTDTPIQESVKASPTLCSMSSSGAGYTLSYSLGGISYQYNQCTSPLAATLSKYETKKSGCGWGKKRKNRYYTWSTSGGQVLGTYKKKGSCK